MNGLPDSGALYTKILFQVNLDMLRFFIIIYTRLEEKYKLICIDFKHTFNTALIPNYISSSFNFYNMNN